MTDILQLILNALNNILAALGGGGSTSTKVQGVDADDAALTGNPVQTGAVACDPASLPAAATSGRVVHFLTDLSRRLLVWAYSRAPANVASAQVTAGAVAGTLAIARATRCQVTFKNIDTSNTVWIGPATVTALNGMQLLAGQSITVRGSILWQVIAPAGSPIVCVTDEYYS